MHKLKVQHHKILTDTTTPVGLYLRIRNCFAQSCLLESSDYHGQENSFSFIGMDSIASFTAKDYKITITTPDNKTETQKINGTSDQPYQPNANQPYQPTDQPWYQP